VERGQVSGQEQHPGPDRPHPEGVGASPFHPGIGGTPHERTAGLHSVDHVPDAQQLGNIDTQLKQNMTEYNNVRQSVNNIERKQTCVYIENPVDW